MVIVVAVACWLTQLNQHVATLKLQVGQLQVRLSEIEHDNIRREERWRWLKGLFEAVRKRIAQHGNRDAGFRRLLHLGGLRIADVAVVRRTGELVVPGRPEDPVSAANDGRAPGTDVNEVDGTVLDASYIGVSTQYLVETRDGHKMTAYTQNLETAGLADLLARGAKVRLTHGAIQAAPIAAAAGPAATAIVEGHAKAIADKPEKVLKTTARALPGFVTAPIGAAANLGITGYRAARNVEAKVEGSITGTKSVELDGKTYEAFVLDSKVSTSGQFESSGTQIDWFIPELRLSAHQEMNTSGNDMFFCTNGSTPIPVLICLS